MNPDREELVSFDAGQDWDAAAHVRLLRQNGGASSGYTADLIERLHTALRRLASSEDAVKGEPEPVALSASERACYLWPDDTEQARACRAAYIDGAKDYTAPPADAGMRKALAAVTVDLVSTADKDEDPFEWSSVKQSYAALGIPLTAPGATTKSDGGAKAGSSPILASKEDQRSDTHGMMPVGDNAANVGSTGVGPSDPSSTRSEVTASLEGDAVERVAWIIDPNARWGVKLDSDYIDLRHEQARLEDRQRIAITKARAILATGLVPDEAAIRADEREKCAKVADGIMYPDFEKSSDIEKHAYDIRCSIAAAIRSNRREA